MEREELWKSREQQKAVFETTLKQLFVFLLSNHVYKNLVRQAFRFDLNFSRWLAICPGHAHHGAFPFILETLNPFLKFSQKPPVPSEVSCVRRGERMQAFGRPWNLKCVCGPEASMARSYPIVCLFLLPGFFTAEDVVTLDIWLIKSCVPCKHDKRRDWSICKNLALSKPHNFFLKELLFHWH